MDDSKIRVHTVLLCNKLDLDKLLPYLKQERMVTNDEYEILTNIGYTKRQRRSKLLIMLPRKGRDYFENFGKCLVWSGQAELARHIGVDVDNVPPSPHQFGDDDDDDPYGNAAMRNQVLLRALQEAISAGTPVSPPSSLPPGYSASSPHHQMTFQTQSAGGYASQTARQPPYYFPGEHATAPPPPPMIPQSMEYESSVPLQHIDSREDFSTAQANASLPPSAPTPTSAPPPPQQTRSGPTKVFILYCKDQFLQTTHGVTPDDFCKDVQELADILSSCGGITCSTDFYEKGNPGNWNIWTQQQIETSNHVVMIASPQLYQHLSKEERTDVEMERGKYFSNTVINTIEAPKFVPVFLNGNEPQSPKHWLPLQLHMSTWFLLRNVREFYNAVDMHGEHTEPLREKFSRHLQDPKYRSLANFILHLLGEHNVVAPVGQIRVAIHPPYIPAHHMLGQPHQQHTVVAPAASRPEDIPEADFLKIAQRLPRDWPHLGIKLGVEYSTIERLRRKHPLDSVPATMEMFKIWKELKGKSATRKVLKKALEELKFGRLATELYPNEKI